jgi:large subunit ribosomal protein L3
MSSTARAMGSRPSIIPRLFNSTPSAQQTQVRTIRSTFAPRPDRFNQLPLPPLTSTSAAALKRKADTLPLRTGVLGFKKGMSAVYDQSTGERSPCTIVQLDRVQVVAHKTRQKHGYYAVQVGISGKDPSNVTKPMLGHFANQGVNPKKHLVEFPVKDAKGLPPVGYQLKPDWFAEGQFVDVKATTKGKGFAGGMKRHGFSGQPASHGASLVHRAMGSAGQSQGGGSRVLPGKRMAGNMGGEFHTTANVKVLKVDIENGLVILKGEGITTPEFEILN